MHNAESGAMRTPGPSPQIAGYALVLNGFGDAILCAPEPAF
jgi:hypothetical protein